MHAGPPVIQQPQHNRALLVRTGTTLHCRAAGYGSLMYHWETNNAGSWKAVSNKNSTHYIASTTGQYRCNVTNKAGSVVSSVITVFGEKLLKLSVLIHNCYQSLFNEACFQLLCIITQVFLLLLFIQPVVL